MKQSQTEDFEVDRNWKRSYLFPQEYARNFDSVNVSSVIPKRAKSVSLVGLRITQNINVALGRKGWCRNIKSRTCLCTAETSRTFTSSTEIQGDYHWDEIP